jgi:hypothetical protein
MFILRKVGRDSTLAHGTAKSFKAGETIQSSKGDYVDERMMKG